ncbi:MAG: sigma-70 family RNA polymerase sigma factor [Planctomycetota bacterium]
MSEPTGSTTNVSLLRRLHKDADDKETWDEFVGRYGAKIHGWCRRWGLQESDADDVTQNVLLALSKQMQTFEYRADGRFRSWLKTVSYRAWCRFHEDRQTAAIATGSDAVRRMLESVEARDDFLRELDRECERNILEDAMKIAQQRVKPDTWTAFYQTAIESIPAAEVAADLEMSLVAVYQARSRVQSMIQEEVRGLQGSEM